MMIEYFITDVDGTLTDGNIYISKRDAYMKFSKEDGMGFFLLRKAGIKSMIVTSESTTYKIAKRRAKQVEADYFYHSTHDKLRLIEDIMVDDNFLNRWGLDWSRVAYIGDDVNDLPVMSRFETVEPPMIPMVFCPADANDKVKRLPFMNICDKSGGDGAVREAIEVVLKYNEEMRSVQNGYVKGKDSS